MILFTFVCPRAFTALISVSNSHTLSYFSWPLGVRYLDRKWFTHSMLCNRMDEMWPVTQCFCFKLTYPQLLSITYGTIDRKWLTCCTRYILGWMRCDQSLRYHHMNPDQNVVWTTKRAVWEANKSHRILFWGDETYNFLVGHHLIFQAIFQSSFKTL